jgi:hypothetical protein
MASQGVSESMDLSSKYNLPAAVIYRDKLKTISQVINIIMLLSVIIRFQKLKIREFVLTCLIRVKNGRSRLRTKSSGWWAATKACPRHVAPQPRTIDWARMWRHRPVAQPTLDPRPGT